MKDCLCIHPTDEPKKEIKEEKTKTRFEKVEETCFNLSKNKNCLFPKKKCKWYLGDSRGTKRQQRFVTLT